MSYNKRILSEIDRELKDRYRSKRYSKSLSATNSLFTVNDLFAKPSRRRIYNPNAQYFQKGGDLNFEEKMDAYADSSKLYDAYKFQKHKMKQIYPKIINDMADEANYPGGGSALQASRDSNIGKFGKKIYNIDWSFNKRRNYDNKDYREKVITDYYKKLIASDPNFKIGNYSSPDLLHKAIKPTGTYFDGIANSPIYRKPVKPVDLLPPPPLPKYEIEDIEPDIEIEKLDVIQPKLLSSDTELPELEERDEVEGVDYERKFGMWLENKAQKDAKLKTFLKYALPEFFNDKPSRVSQYYRYPKKLRAGFYNEPIEEEQLYPEGFIANMKFQRGGLVKAIAKNSKKLLTKKDLNVIKSAAKDFKKYAIRSTDITVPGIKKAQSRLLEAIDPKSRTIMSGVGLTPDGKRLKITADKRIQGSQDRSIDILKPGDEERLQASGEYLKEEADLLKRNAESYLENPYAIDLNRGDHLKFDKDGFLIEPLGGFYHGIGSTSPGFNLENLEFDRSKLDPEVMKGWTSTGNKHGNSRAEYGFFGALNKNQGNQAALKYDGTREHAVMEMMRDPSKRPANLGTIKEIGLSPNARLVGGNSPYVLNALKDVGINITKMSQGPHIGGQNGMTPQKAAILRSKYGIDGIIDLGGSELAIFNPDIITGVSDVPFKLFDYTNPLMQSLRQAGMTATDIKNTLQNRFGSSYIHPNKNQPYIPADHSWAVGGADKLGSMMDNTNAYDARAILQTRGAYFTGGLRIDPYGRPDIFSAGLPFSEKWWKAAEPNLDLIRQKGGPINTSGPRAEEAPVDKDAMNAMMKARLAYEYEKGNPAAKRMVAPVDNPYDFGDGRTGTHYMSSYDNYAIPEIQDVDGTLEMTGPRDNEAIRFDREEDARYFANENYKRVSPMFINAELDNKEIQKYVDGGYIVEEMAEGGGVEVESCPTGQAWNGKYCVKIQIVTEDGKKIRVVPTSYEIENPSDNPQYRELQSVEKIENTIKQGKEEGWSDELVDKMLCKNGSCNLIRMDEDTEIEDIEPVKKRRSIEDIYPEVDHDKYPTIEDFIFASDYYKENGEDPSDDLLPSNRVEEEPEVEPEVEEELDIEPLPVIEPDPIVDDRIIEEEEYIEDELPSAEEFYADSLPVTNSEGEIVLPYEETTGKSRRERRGTRRPNTKDRSWDGIKGNLQRIFTDKEYSGPWFPNKKIKQEGGVPEFQGGGVAKALSKAANKTRSQIDLLKKINPQLSKVIPRFVANSLDNQLTGIDRGGRELLSKFTNAKDSRKFSEIFPITKSQQKAADLLQQGALEEGVDFVKDWFYKFDSDLGMALRPEISDKILDLYEFSGSGNNPGLVRGDKYFAEDYRNAGKRLGEIDQPLDNTLQYSNSKFGLNYNNPFIQTRDILTGRGRSILNDASLSENQKIELLKTRLENETNGVNYSQNPDMRLSTTDSNFGRFRKPSNEIMETGLHEATHTAQNLGRETRSFGNILSKWDPDREYYYANKDNPIGQFFSEIMPDEHWVGSPNELHAELMIARKKTFDSWRKDPKVKKDFKRDFETGRTLGIPERDEKIKEWALGELRNPSNTTLDWMIENKNLNRFFKEGTSREKKYQALRYLPGLAVPFALPGLTDDDKPKLQKGGGISRPDIEYKSNKEIQDDAGSPSTGVGGYYDPTQNRIVIPPSATQHVLDHENFHAVQRGMGRMRVDPMTPKQEPSMLSSDELVNNYYNRHMNDVNSYYDNYADIVNPSSEQHERYLNVNPDLYNNPDLASEAPEVVTAFNKYWPKDMDLMTDEIKYRKAIEPLLYEDSYTMEGEAEAAARVLGQRRADYAERYPESKYGFPIDMFDAIEEDGLNPTLDYIFTGQRQMGGALELGDEVTENMVEELKRQGYTIEEI